MKYKKYILIFMMFFTINIGKTYALENNNYLKTNSISILSDNKIITNNSFAIIGANASSSECESLFGNANDQNSIRYLIDLVLDYVRIIVPLLVIVLGTIDIAKAVVAGKEDEMKKAEKTFVKRIIAGVVVFFVPVFVNIIMWLADIAWQGLGYSTCGL